MKNGARTKSVIRAPIAKPGNLQGVDPYPTRSLFRRSSPTEEGQEKNPSGFFDLHQVTFMLHSQGMGIRSIRKIFFRRSLS